MGVITFNGVSTNSKRFSAPILVEQPPDYAFPGRDASLTHVPGRHGDIFVDNGSYNNVTRSYNLAIGNEEVDYARLAYELSDWLHGANGYAKLTDSYDPTHYCMAVFIDEGTIANILNHAARVSVNFKCKPQRYLVSGDDTLTFESGGNSGVTIFNPTMYDARPLIKVYGNFSSSGGGFSLETIEGENSDTSLAKQSVTVLKCTGSVTIDSELMDCYRIDNPEDPETRSVYNANGDVMFSEYSFPVIHKGLTKLTWSPNITKVEVIPRWWTI